LPGKTYHMKLVGTIVGADLSRTPPIISALMRINLYIAVTESPVMLSAAKHLAAHRADTEQSEG